MHDSQQQSGPLFLHLPTLPIPSIRMQCLLCKPTITNPTTSPTMLKPEECSNCLQHHNRLHNTSMHPPHPLHPLLYLPPHPGLNIKLIHSIKSNQGLPMLHKNSYPYQQPASTSYTKIARRWAKQDNDKSYTCPTQSVLANLPNLQDEMPPMQTSTHQSYNSPRKTSTKREEPSVQCQQPYPGPLQLLHLQPIFTAATLFLQQALPKPCQPQCHTIHSQHTHTTTNTHCGPMPHHQQHQTATHCLLGVGQCHTYQHCHPLPNTTHTTSKQPNTLPITHNLHPCHPTHQPLHTKHPTPNQPIATPTST